MQFPDLNRRNISLPFFQPFRFIHAEKKRGPRRVTANLHSSPTLSPARIVSEPVLQDKTDHPQLVTTCTMI